MSEVHLHATERSQRLIKARLSLKRAEQHIGRYPHAAATPVVQDLKDALTAIMAELETK